MMVLHNAVRTPLRQSADESLYSNVGYVVFDKYDSDAEMSVQVLVHWTRVFDYMDKSKGYGGQVLGVKWDISDRNSYAYTHPSTQNFSFGGMLSNSKTGKAESIYVGTGGNRTVVLRRDHSRD